MGRTKLFRHGHEWRTAIRVRAPLPALPCPMVACEECRNTPAYHWDGRRRQSEDFAVLQCTLSGEGRIRRRGEEFRLPPGTAFLCAADDPEVVYFYPPEARRVWRFVYLLFRGGDFRRVATDLADRCGSVLRLAPTSAAFQALVALRAHHGQGVELDPGAGARLVYGLVTEMASAAVRARDGAGAGNPLVARSWPWMEAGLTGGATPVAKIARRLGVSREHFTRVFRHETGQSPKAWLARRQMVLAAHTVKAGELSVKEIADRFGYPSAAAFAKAFGRHFGISPTRFRRDGVPPLA